MIFTRQRVINTAIFFVAAGFILVAPTFFDEYTMRILSNIAIFAILAVSYNLINGVTGQFSLEPNGFVAIGAYITALLLLSADEKVYQFVVEEPTAFVVWMNSGFVAALIISGLAASLVAFTLAFPVFRVRGDYLAIVTLGFGFIIQILAINNPQVTNGSLGLSDIPEHANFYWTGFAALFTVLFILNVVNSKYGRAMKAVRDDEDAAGAMGINTFKIKTTAFCTSAFFEGVGGGLLAVLLTTVSPDQFTFFLTFQLLIIIVLGGLGSTTGAIVGTILVIGGSEWLRFLDESMNIFGYETPAMPGLRMVVFSVILILVMLFARRGLFGNGEVGDLLKKLKSKKR
ncbi:MAG: branched-chain amino acid ABC transporter permease [Campylobacteraceae bacterium]|jgi:branched-chain amino acid transport system permease protein|nr:branched-chain amino acid ABC transporter permease [Campylobacteraceae bacterium]